MFKRAFLLLPVLVTLWEPARAKPIDSEAVAFAYRVLQAHHGLTAASVDLLVQKETGTTVSHLHFKDDQVHCTTTGAGGYRQIYFDPSITVVARALVKGTLVEDNWLPRMRPAPRWQLQAFAAFLLRMREEPPEYFLWYKSLEIVGLHRRGDGQPDGFEFKGSLSSGTMLVDPDTLLIREVQSVGRATHVKIQLSYDLRVPTPEQMAFDDPPEGFDVETYLPEP